MLCPQTVTCKKILRRTVLQSLFKGRSLLKSQLMTRYNFTVARAVFVKQTLENKNPFAFIL